MVLWSTTGGRATLVALCALLALSTGVASGTLLDQVAVTGHTTFAEQVRGPGPGIAGPEDPLIYGLATQRVAYLFGLFSTQRPLDAPGDQMVFAWAEDAPDPRGDPGLRATGDIARVWDQTGTTWTVFELDYRGPDPLPPGASPYVAYAVAVGPVRSLEDGSVYNHVLTYRPDRLVAPLLDDDRHGTAHPVDPALVSYPVATGVGTTPPVLTAAQG